MTQTQLIITISLIAVITLLTRALPFLLFPDGRKTPAFILYLGKALPFASIGMLVVYCFKSVRPLQSPYGLPELTAAIFVLAVHKWKHNMCLSIAGGTILYMVLLRIIG